ncbi:YdiU family protein [Paenibacillus yanchengensis]|uniref:Protein nucleotidyltransferase YdiU n=1 Tax=Paenibacillus yanchengensis TaxID=2035833 RepID=A0ABW4YLV8_9BACL
MTLSLLQRWKLDNSYQQLPEIFFAKQSPTSVAQPELVLFNDSLADYLELSKGTMSDEEIAHLLSGNQLPNNFQPISQAYAGHQFGHFTMLGDGRAILLGEHVMTTGKRLDIQLKGAGPTIYSRSGDGRATLGPMLREYIISEAMHGLQIPTTRSLAVVASGELVYREQPLPGAILIRVAASHLRVGTIQYAANWGTVEQLQQLVDYAIWRHDSHLLELAKPARYGAFLEAVMERQCRLVAQWQLVGFIHGVMNTDNMTISGETIDYGPCAFMDTYFPDTVFSSIDSHGRYAYKNQPNITLWNVTRLAEAMLPLLAEQEEAAIGKAEAILQQFPARFHIHWESGMFKKLGLTEVTDHTKRLLSDLLQWMEESKADFTNTFRLLTISRNSEVNLHEQLATNNIDQWIKVMIDYHIWTKADAATLDLAQSFQLWQQWYMHWHKQLLAQANNQAAASYDTMKQVNPAIIARNHLVEQLLAQATENQDASVLDSFITQLQQPFAYNEEQISFAALPHTCSKPYSTYCGT